MIGAAALAMSSAFVSCSKDKDLYDPASNSTRFIEQYQQAFLQVFGQPAADQTWGFGSASATRAITVNGDVYDVFNFPTEEELTAAFPTAIPEGADEVSELDKYIGQQTGMWDLYAIYSKMIVEGYNLKITQAGTFELGGSYQNVTWENGQSVAHPYNVFVDVDGDVTIKRNGSTHFNLYILKGNVTLESDYGEQAGLISVADGATLNDQRTSIAANQGIKVYNRGTVNATNADGYDIGNFASFYNEAKFNVTGALSYSPGSSNTSYLVNFGDGAEITAPSMTMNSSCHFYNSGKVNVSGETFVTQKNINWINNGYYKTGKLTFSAWNNTFYNYCQLIVEGEAYMFDGQFNLMANSYTEAGSAKLDNFIVNMGGNTGMYIKGNVRLLGQGDATYQGFESNETTNNYLLIDGKVTVDAHYHTFCISNGITYSINAIEIVRGEEVVTDEQLKEWGDGAYPSVYIEGTECPYGDLTVTVPKANECGAKWIKKGSELPSLHVMAEDLSATEKSDFDFNDVVIDVYYVDANTVKINLLAAGGTLPLRICENDLWEVHYLFDVPVTCMVNTGKKYHVAKAPYSQVEVLPLVPLTYTGWSGWSTDQDTFAEQVRDHIKLEVDKGQVDENGKTIWYELKATPGEPACKIATPVKISVDGWYENVVDATVDPYRWAWEKQYVGEEFAEWVQTGIPFYTVVED